MDDPRPINDERKPEDDGTPVSRLTRREREVYQLLKRARSNKEIGGVLGIEERTARFYVGNILRKLSLSSRIQILAENWPERQ